MRRPRLAVTLGDPAGIGPEVCERALRAHLPAATADVVLLGPAGLADTIAARLGHGVVAQVQAPFAAPPAMASAAGGRAALAALDAAMALAAAGDAQALVTAPINKQALHLAGSADLGHTEILARRLGRGPTAMAFFTPRLKLVLATVHVPLRSVFGMLTLPRVVDVARLLATALAPAGGRAHLALAGLNPHAGEAGLMGDEERTVLAPAAAAARRQGIDLSDPIAPDTVFRRAVDGEFDGVVALYHDQGLIPVKLLDFGAAVNVTLGLRVVRTSPDHGTAFDRVGKHGVRPDGMLAALRCAEDMIARAAPAREGA